ncbi:hypothetical protein [Roseovarius sp. E0-M6]|uniref:hypothetical protein n=1 Tax=Roseovarius sp. E0-M6 TaxID=3127118 RepID=UPI00300FD325
MFKTTNRAGRNTLGRLIKWLIYLIIIAFIALIAYAYIGPFFGADFTPPLKEIRQEIILEGN